jgi:hypothetical protein
MKGTGLNKIIVAALFPVLVAVSPVLAGDTPPDASGRPVTVIKGARPYAGGPAQRVFYYSNTRNEGELIRIRDRLAAAGARAISATYPDAVVCELPVGVDPGQFVAGTDVVARVQRLDAGAAAPLLPENLDWLSGAYDMYDARRAAANGEPRLERSPAAGDIVDLMQVSRSAIERSAFLAAERQRLAADPGAIPAQDQRLPDQNSEFLAGNIHIQIVFLEEKNSGSWTKAERDAVKAGVEFVKMYFDQQFRNLRTNFTTRAFDVEIGWDPIRRGVSDEVTDIRPLAHEVMTRMGYLGEPAEYLDLVNDFNNDARNAYSSADWVFTVFVVDASHDDDYMFDTGRKQLFSHLGGPFMVMAYPTVVPGIANFEQYFKHAMTTIFWGLPEDMNSTPGSCASKTGYLNVAHKNKVTAQDPLGGRKDCDNDPPDPCIAMFSDIEFGYAGAPCDFTKAQLGNRDSDNDNVPDVFDAPPSVVFLGSAVDTLTSLGQPVSFNVRSRAVPNENPLQNHERRDYTTAIERVSYKLNGIGPIVVEPIDGVADEAFEQYELEIGFLLPGYSEIEVTAWNNFGAKSPPRYKDIFYIGLDYFSFRFEHRNEGTGVAWYLRGETFGADLELHRIDYADSSDTVVAGPDVLRPVRPKQDGLTPYYFLDKAAAAGKQYGYYATGSIWLDIGGTPTEFRSSSRVFDTVTSIPRRDGILSVPAPNPFRHSAGDEKLRISVNIPGAQGIPLFNGGGISRAAAQQATPEPTNLKVAVYDVAGREVAVLFDEAVYDMVVNIEWDGNNSTGRRVPTGMYFIKARAAEVMDTKKVLVIH